jgi:hypothetical protein
MLAPPTTAIVPTLHPYRKVVASTLDLLKIKSTSCIRHTSICVESSPGEMETAYPINFKKWVTTEAKL